MFKIGQKIVCIDASPVPADCAKALPLRLTLNSVYTVASIHIEPHIEGYGIRLEELPNPSMIWADSEEKEWSYSSKRFRPLVENNDSVEMQTEVS